MSTTAVNDFLTKVQSDEALQQELATALEAENDRKAVTELAENKGYDFTPEELWAEVQKRQAEAEANQTEGELSDEELESVAGGAGGVKAALGLSAITAPMVYDAAKNIKW